MESHQSYAAQAIQQLHKVRFKDLILFEDEDYLLINKPAFISTLDDRNDDLSIISMARDYVESAQVCHRLDKETSGALLIAKNPDAYRSASMQFEHRKVKKIYHAVCDGIHDFRELKVDLPIYATSKGVVKISKREGKEALTFINTLKAYRKYTLVECQPVTGRMHQIRIHLSSQGAPISGDEQYGGKPFFLSALKKNYNLKKDAEEQPLMKRVALHAQAFTFKLMNQEDVRVEAPYPKDFAVLIKQLEKLN
ncbi:RluA family pseudouridine synthase [Catalinimonas niigatensis]|uniref:RluA family pseudouridine synthase n=1 Tax=Catalinimonas niigatensis TaxID=1397264 RepID=UPI002666B332|nr:pseudouridine synthase [Catalinimonas niigatensis]WPP49030.1 pseudouridine synthase [Catalinimonas niigatensis]